MHHSLLVLPILALAAASAIAAETESTPTSANEIAATLAKKQEGSSYVRLHLEVKSGAESKTLQLQIKERHTARGADLVAQVLWPKDQKGQSVLLHKSGGTLTGTGFTPPDAVHQLTAAQMKEPFFGSDLSYEDMIDSFFAWESQTTVGTEPVDRVACQILESKPGGARSSYGKVRSWIDTRRMVPLRVEKYSSSGQLMRRIETTRVASDDRHQPIPANLLVRDARPGSTTEVDGNKIRHDITFSEREFSVEGLKEVAIPRGSPE